MIVDFPEAKQRIKKALDAEIRKQVKAKAPVYSMIPKKQCFEGDTLSTTHPDGKKDVRQFEVVESGFTIPRDEVPETKPQDMLAKLAGAADDMAGQIERGIFATLNKSLTESGNMIPGNPALNRESILKGLEAVWIDFEDDDRSKPILPSIVAAPPVVEHLMKDEAAATEEERESFRNRQEGILDRKYKEYMDDLASRRLVD